jgi:hypothetical protein
LLIAPTAVPAPVQVEDDEPDTKEARYEENKRWEKHICMGKKQGMLHRRSPDIA